MGTETVAPESGGGMGRTFVVHLGTGLVGVVPVVDPGPGRGLQYKAIVG